MLFAMQFQQPSARSLYRASLAYTMHEQVLYLSPNKVNPPPEILLPRMLFLLRIPLGLSTS